MFSLESDHDEPPHFDEPSLNVPPHLRNASWLAFEAAVLSELLPDVQAAVRKLTKRLSSKRVHAARINLRRWQAVGQVIANNDWEKSEYQDLYKLLNKLRKSLGKLRDCEILLELADDLKLPPKLIRRWKADYKSLLEQVDKCLHKTEPIPQLKSTTRLVKGRRKQYELHKDVSQFGYVSAFNHLQPFLGKLEEQTRELEPKAVLPEQLHELRIMIKNWRYFLAEFYGLTNLELVKAQQILGKLHDLDQLLAVLTQSGDLSMLDNQKLKRINKMRKKLLGEFDSLRKNLPYGLRPTVTSYVQKSITAK